MVEPLTTNSIAAVSQYTQLQRWLINCTKTIWPPSTRYPASLYMLLPSTMAMISSRCFTASWRHFQIICSPLQHPHSQPARYSHWVTRCSTKSSVSTLENLWGNHWDWSTPSQDNRWQNLVHNRCFLRYHVPTSIPRRAESTPTDPTTSGTHTQHQRQTSHQKANQGPRTDSNDIIYV